MIQYGNSAMPPVSYLVGHPTGKGMGRVGQHFTTINLGRG
jgi:hypothetical protein